VEVGIGAIECIQHNFRIVYSSFLHFNSWGFGFRMVAWGASNCELNPVSMALAAPAPF
jgi:hypothetical protein